MPRASVLWLRGGLDDPVAKVRDLGGIHDLEDLEIDGAQIVVEAHARAEQDRGEGDVNLIQQPGRQSLPKRGPGPDLDVPVTCRLPGLADGALDSVGYENKRRIRRVPFSWRIVG